MEDNYMYGDVASAVNMTDQYAKKIVPYVTDVDYDARYKRERAVEILAPQLGAYDIDLLIEASRKVANFIVNG